MAKQKDTPEIIQAPTNFNIRLDDKIYTVNFGTAAFLRIKDERPLLTSVFHLTDELDPVEVIPLLIYVGISPKTRDWENFDDFLEAYDRCEDEATTQVISGYLSACGALAKKLTPALEAVKKFQQAGTK